MKIPEAIKTDRIIIRPFTSKDLPGYLSFMTDPEATKYLLFEPIQKTKKGALDLYNLIITSYESDTPIWALTIADENDEFIGSCGISPIDKNIYECYYSLLPEQWGQGYATEAIQSLIDYLFQNTPIIEIRAYISPKNSKAAKVAKRAGMNYNGIHNHPIFNVEGLLYLTRKKDN